MLNNDNEIIIDEDKLVELFLQGNDVHMVTMENTISIDRYNQFCNLFLIDKKIDVELPNNGSDKYNKESVNNWWMPDEYKNLNIIDYLLSKTNNEKEYQRVIEELAEFQERGLMPLLNYMVYFVTTMDNNNVVMGVGRGSSVASYILYLIGVHKVDSIKYDLDYKEFFR
jgi:DNA polymerase III alpha subunit